MPAKADYASIALRISHTPRKRHIDPDQAPSAFHLREHQSCIEHAAFAVRLLRRSGAGGSIANSIPYKFVGLYIAFVDTPSSQRLFSKVD
jgi:hypothetical protein